MSYISYPLLHDTPPQTWWLKTTSVLLLFTRGWVIWKVLQWTGTLTGWREPWVGWCWLASFTHLAVGLVLAVCLDTEVVIGCSVTHPWASEPGLVYVQIVTECWRAVGEGKCTCANTSKMSLLALYFLVPRWPQQVTWQSLGPE